jgi:predicted transglutaminase-like cysteine proteinase
VRVTVPPLASLLAVLACLAWGSEPGYSSSVTAGLIQHFVVKFGADAKLRLAGWQQFPSTRPRADAPARELDSLSAVNAFFNRTPFVTDIAHWGEEDYWATPAEMLSSNGGDCEDYSVAKYYMLKELGVPLARLRIVYVKSTRLNQAHMVLAYYASPQAEPLILDNLEERVLPASSRTDLIPVYSFNDEDVRIAGQKASAGSAAQIRQWRALQQKLQRELRL